MHLFPSLLCAIVFGGVLGSLLGSFFNVLGMRMGTGRGLGGRSSCMSCGHRLSWYELIPIFSYVFLRGKCSACSSRISTLYCIGEILVAGLFIHAALIAHTWIELAILMLLACLLVSIVMYDVRHSIIPNVFTAGVLFIGIITTSILVFIPDQLPLFSQVFPVLGRSFIFDRLCAALMVPVPFLLLSYFSGGRWFGWGDGKFMVATGFVTGFFMQIEFLVVSFWIALTCVVLALCLECIITLFDSKSKNMSLDILLESLFPGHRLPFGPFLCASLWLSLTGFHIIHIMLGL